MHLLDTITIKGFKSIASIERLKLRPINVLIGANGSGKSDFLGVFSFLHAIRAGRLQWYLREAGGASQVLHFGAEQTETIHIHISFNFNEGENQYKNQYKIDLQRTNADVLVPQSEVIDVEKNTPNESHDPDREERLCTEMEASISVDSSRCGSGLLAKI